MGLSISSVIRSILPSSTNAHSRREAEDVLNTLIHIAEDKARIHRWKVTKHPLDEGLLPVEKVARELHMVHCGVKREEGEVREVMRCCLGGMESVTGEVVEGLTAVALQTLEKLLERIDGKMSSEMSSYAILVGEKGEIGRLDCYMFYYRFGSSIISEVAEDCLITSLVFSTVDTASLRARNLEALVRPTFSVPLPGEKPQNALHRMKAVERALMKTLDHEPRRALPKTLPSIEEVLTDIGGDAGQKIPRR